MTDIEAEFIRMYQNDVATSLEELIQYIEDDAEYTIKLTKEQRDQVALEWMMSLLGVLAPIKRKGES